LLFGLIGALFGHGASQEAALDDKSKDIIFNAKAIKMKREEANKLVKARAKKTQSMAKSEAPAAGAKAASAPEEATAPKSTARAAHALASLRSSGLSALVGRIAKRAAKQGVMVASIGVSPETKGAGNAFFSQGKSTVGGGGFAKEGTSYRLGGINTHGTGGGAGGTAKAGSGLSGGSVGTGDVALVDEETVIEGGLDREVIADVIKRNLGQIRYCYERQLSSNKDLYGKVMVRFTIGPGGEVGNPKIDNSTMKSALVEGCILRRVASWKFPLPKGGTTVNVAYPFLFKAVQ
jgi:TonB family protein